MSDDHEPPTDDPEGPDPRRDDASPNDEPVFGEPPPSDVPSAKEEKPSPAEKDYEVGYGKPPKATQFQPGQRANPLGRPKGSRGLKTIARKHYGRAMSVQQDGKRKTVSAIEALFQMNFVAALQGDQKAIARHFSLAQQLDAEDSEHASRHQQRKLSAEDEAIIARFLARQDPDEPPNKTPEGESDND